MKKSMVIIFLFLIAPLTALFAGDIVVSPDGDVKSVKQAVEMAEPGSHIRVEEGTYVEYEIEITKPLTLEGANRPVIDGDYAGNIFIVRADSVTIRGFTIKNTKRSYVTDYAAILIENSEDFLIEDNHLTNVYFGIYLAETDRGIVRDNTVESYELREASSGNGIHLWSSRNPLIKNNDVSGMRDGIYLEFVEEAEVYGNSSIGNNRYGLHYMFSDGGTYTGNLIRDNGAGVAVMYSENVNMKNNLFEHNWGSAAYGLLLKDIGNSTIEGNRFYRNTVAIYSEGSTNLKIHRNEIEMNGWAVNIKSSSTGNRFTENNFIENSFDVRTDSPRNNNEFEGNYWSSYEGYDLDRDGVGDVPYRPVSLFSMIIERQPESLILMRSMFIRLLNTAERVAPVLTPKTLFDDKPKKNRIQ